MAGFEPLANLLHQRWNIIMKPNKLHSMSAARLADHATQTITRDWNEHNS